MMLGQADRNRRAERRIVSVKRVCHPGPVARYCSIALRSTRSEIATLRAGRRLAVMLACPNRRRDRQLDLLDGDPHEGVDLRNPLFGFDEVLHRFAHQAPAFGHVLRGVRQFGQDGFNLRSWQGSGSLYLRFVPSLCPDAWCPVEHYYLDHTKGARNDDRPCR